ncbi:DNA damage-regulated autophagy modulator protein 1 isoform X6 [Mauremys reevesii]|uniref:DNA damage-regulated autophagy modulator protein 1 isoform X6 n=1 Tax=Mauremys reevesii TaxID=260615 RepID=UPI00193F75E8|nr:DNA damage-regulated autophagy modulator protein 1 isoform X6 [Mauremys reevesii]
MQDAADSNLGFKLRIYYAPQAGRQWGHCRGLLLVVPSSFSQYMLWRQSRERELLDQTQEELQEQSWQYQCNIKSSQYCNEEKRELSVPSVHDGGALVAFGSGVVYITLQSVISFKSCPQWNSHSTCYIRIAISIVSWIAVIPMIACASLISITKVDWIPGEKDYTYHFVSAICEWTVAFGFIFFFLTFIRDFQGVTLRILTEMHEDF